MDEGGLEIGLSGLQGTLQVLAGAIKFALSLNSPKNNKAQVSLRSFIEIQSRSLGR